MLGYDAWQITAILATYLVAAGVKGITGLGFSTTCLPFLAFIVGLKEALPLVIIPSISSNLVVMYGAGRFRETVLRFWPMLLATVPGLVLGLWALSAVDGRQAGAALGAILLVWCGFSLAKPEITLSARLAAGLGPFSGAITGFINGVTGSQVMPLVPFLMMQRLHRDLFIQGVNCSFTMSSLIMAIGLGGLGLFTLDALLVSLAGVAVMVFGLRAGEKMRHRLSPDRFRLAVLFVLMAMGISLLGLAL